MSPFINNETKEVFIEANNQLVASNKIIKIKDKIPRFIEDDDYNERFALWHQDEGIWAHHKTLSNQKPFTCWIPIEASEKNTLQVCLDEFDLREHKRDDYMRPYAQFLDYEVRNNKIINPIIRYGYIFSAFQPHRSYIAEKVNSMRISIDFRFTI